MSRAQGLPGAFKASGQWIWHSRGSKVIDSAPHTKHAQSPGLLGPSVDTLLDYDPALSDGWFFYIW